MKALHGEAETDHVAAGHHVIRGSLSGSASGAGLRHRPGRDQILAVVCCVVESKIRQAWSMRRRSRRVPALRSSFAGFRFPPDVITLAVRWYLRYGLSYRDVEELLVERGITVDHVSVYRLGAAVHPAADRRGTTLPARPWRPVVRR